MGQEIVEARQRRFDWGVNKWLGHNGVVESRRHHHMRGSGSSNGGKTGVYKWLQVENMHGKAHLSMDVATESEVADTEGSTATTVSQMLAG